MSRSFKAQDGQTYRTLEELVLASREHELPNDLRELEDGRIVSSSWSQESGEEPTVFAQAFTVGQGGLYRTRSIEFADGSGFAIVREEYDGECSVIAIATKDELCGWTDTFMAWLEGGQVGPMPELPGLITPTPPDLQ